MSLRTYVVTLNFDAFLLDIHSKHLFDSSISNGILPHSNGSSSYTPNDQQVSNKTKVNNGEQGTTTDQ